MTPYRHSITIYLGAKNTKLCPVKLFWHTMQWKAANQDISSCSQTNKDLRGISWCHTWEWPSLKWELIQIYMLIIVFELVLPLWCIWKTLIHNHDARKMESAAYQRYVCHIAIPNPPANLHPLLRLAFSVTVIFVCMPVNASKPHSFSYGQEDGAVSQVNLIMRAWYNFCSYLVGKSA